MISNYINIDDSYKYITDRERSSIGTETLFYRQIYYQIDLPTFKQLSDCSFWNSCSLNDYFLNRTSIDLIIKKNLNDFEFSYSIEFATDININKTIFNPDGNKNVLIEPIKRVNKLSFLITQVEIFTTKNLLEFYSPPTKV
jgi:hypothetical protein